VRNRYSLESHLDRSMLLEMGPLLVGYDGRDPSKHAIEHALKEAALRGVSVVVLVVAVPHYEAVNPYEPGTVDIGLIEPIPAEGPLEIQPTLADARELVAGSGVEATVEWRQGDPVTEILDAAKRLEASAIVIGSHPHSAIGRFFGTDTAEEIIKDAPCDVLVSH
jgi:nucleotide-binding universal stress UspA family protein